MNRFVIMVDAGYLLRQALAIVSGKVSKSRSDLQITDPAGLIKAIIDKSLATLALQDKELLRVYWYDGVASSLTPQQRSLVAVRRPLRQQRQGDRGFGARRCHRGVRPLGLRGEDGIHTSGARALLGGPSLNRRRTGQGGLVRDQSRCRDVAHPGSRMKHASGESVRCGPPRLLGATGRRDPVRPAAVAGHRKHVFLSTRGQAGR
jgi:hypothetical protein